MSDMIHRWMDFLADHIHEITVATIVGVLVWAALVLGSAALTKHRVRVERPNGELVVTGTVVGSLDGKGVRSLLVTLDGGTKVLLPLEGHVVEVLFESEEGQ